MRDSGHSLLEVIVVVSIIGVVAAAAAPQYTRTVENAKADQAIETLRSLWGAQRIYRLENGAFADSLKALYAVGLIDRIALKPGGPFTYELTGSNDAFLAEAERTGSQWNGSFTIDEEGTLGGWLQNAGGERVTP